MGGGPTHFVATNFGGLFMETLVATMAHAAAPYSVALTYVAKPGTTTCHARQGADSEIRARNVLAMVALHRRRQRAPVSPKENNCRNPSSMEYAAQLPAAETRRASRVEATTRPTTARPASDSGHRATTHRRWIRPLSIWLPASGHAAPTSPGGASTSATARAARTTTSTSGPCAARRRDVSLPLAIGLASHQPPARVAAPLSCCLFQAAGRRCRASSRGAA